MPHEEPPCDLPHDFTGAEEMYSFGPESPAGHTAEPDFTVRDDDYGDDLFQDAQMHFGGADGDIPMETVHVVADQPTPVPPPGFDDEDSDRWEQISI